MHKYHSSASNSPTSATPKRRPPLALLKRGGSVLPSPEVNSATSSRESAFSFHQNPRNSLLFGKNNVFAFDGETEKPGYLSLLQDINRLLLILKWTPNSLLHHEPQTLDGQHKSSCCSTPISVRMETITHLHLHQNDDFKSSIICVVLIDSDGVQQFSFKFMLRGHCLTFLKALETGLSPLFRIEPTLDSIKFSDTLLTENYEKTLQQNMSAELTNSTENCSKRRNSSMSSKSGGLVFRIVSFASPSQQQQKAANALVRTRNFSHGHTCTVSSRSSTQTQDSKGDDQTADTTLRDSLVMATRAMQNQIQSRAFYGWLSYCRHMKTIRTQLATIVLASNDFPMEPDDANLPVNECFWRICRSEKTIPTYKQFLTRVYFHGIEPDIRAQAWPYLLRVVEWHEDFETDNRLANMKERYREDIEEWLKIELAMKEKEKDGQAISRQNSDCFEFAPKDYPPAYSSSVSSDVFDDCDFPSLKELNEEVMDEKEMLAKEFGINLTRVQKDVDRCDRTTKFYSKTENLELLRRVMCTHVYRCLKVDLNDGYVQGMCDLLAPLLVIFWDEALTLACFERLMLRMGKNFPQNTQATSGMEESLNYFRYLVEVMDPELYAQLMRNVDYSFVVFYRWLLLDFKRELLYAEVFQLWEVIWAAEVMCSRHFTLFFGLALLTQYREILIENEMDFTDVIKFFNEMAEKHNVLELLDIARKKISAFQKVILELNNTNKD